MAKTESANEGWHGPGARTRRGWRFRWSDVLWQLVFPRSGHRVLPTTSGSVLIALCFGIGTAAYNSANNILFITLSLLLACLILSGVLSWMNFRRVSWRVQLSPPLRAGQPASLTLELRNEKKFLPTHGLWFEVTTSPVVPPAPAAVKGKSSKSRPVREILAAVEKGRTRGQLFQRTRLDAGAELRLNWVFVPSQRGALRFSLEGVGSRFPFGFLQKSIGTGLRREVVVWPAPVEYRRWGAASSRPQASGERVTRSGTGGDLLALRKYAIGDSHRLIHWKASARTQQLLVRQFTAESQEMLSLWLQTSADRWTRPEQFELLISFVATLADDLFRAGKLMSVAIDEAPPRVVRRVADLEAFLDDLAVIQPSVEAPSSSERAAEPAETARVRRLGRKNVVTFVADGPHGVAAYVDGEKTAAT
jgi:uncharacterized protein (DUF58 family)